jgi:hypothetical protein
MLLRVLEKVLRMKKTEKKTKNPWDLARRISMET